MVGTSGAEFWVSSILYSILDREKKLKIGGMNTRIFGNPFEAIL